MTKKREAEPLSYLKSEEMAANCHQMKGGDVRKTMIPSLSRTKAFENLFFTFKRVRTTLGCFACVTPRNPVRVLKGGLKVLYFKESL